MSDISGPSAMLFFVAAALLVDVIADVDKRVVVRHFTNIVLVLCFRAVFQAFLSQFMARAYGLPSGVEVFGVVDFLLAGLYYLRFARMGEESVPSEFANSVTRQIVIGSTVLQLAWLVFLLILAPADTDRLLAGGVSIVGPGIVVYLLTYHRPKKVFTGERIVRRRFKAIARLVCIRAVFQMSLSQFMTRVYGLPSGVEVLVVVDVLLTWIYYLRFAELKDEVVPSGFANSLGRQIVIGSSLLQLAWLVLLPTSVSLDVDRLLAGGVSILGPSLIIVFILTCDMPRMPAKA